jgi:hypothetical protein
VASSYGIPIVDGRAGSARPCLEHFYSWRLNGSAALYTTARLSVAGRILGPPDLASK